MATEVIMPKAGMDMQEGTIVKWLKKEGDSVSEGDPILEIITDKVNMEVEAECDGVLIKIVAKEGDVLPVFTPIAYIGNVGESIGEDKKKNTETEKIRATPAARSEARNSGINLEEVEGTGPKNRIQKIDIINHKDKIKITPLAKNIATSEKIDINTIKGSGFGGKIVKEDVVSKIEDNNENIIPLSPMRKVISRRMSQSFFSAPTFTIDMEVDMTNIKILREKVMDKIMERTNYKVTYTDFIVLATMKNLKKHKIINSSLVEEGILIHDHVSIALAVGLDEGLLVPVIKNVHHMGLEEIILKSRDLTTRALNGGLKPEEQEGSTFTISNMGMYGVNRFNPIINQPNSAILGVSAMADKPMVVDGGIKIRPMMNISMTIDHRVIDGTPGAKFLKDLKDMLEDPTLLIF
ncbi:MAG: 2-oxo acid dehydrogenase subunit E2 [Anaeromicrobium sp.]|jgi:pyruvate dehydrogenase E2 component (dihydrolipoamide acetyltransferase)|uniref:dihydrolipoamide acetyltransferase family protein n=1 Tax=Anaeromicrobium sp. TaxID=1929132 RepID=UPI0025D689C1|nr:dihydrolipoamide acetyltransferase family protein [Anaeromicrobium sp.]MCT4593923.1 2-oxo acid dehydrogenase subunit E2 [Anaeromicrobium sp.]